MSTVSLSYDLARDDDAQAFRVAVAAEDLFSALLDFYLLAVRKRDARSRARPSHVVRAQLRQRIPQRTAAWALKANALKPRSWRRPARTATLTFGMGFPYLALLNSEAIFATLRAIDASFRDDDAPVPWKEMVATIEARLDEYGLAAAFETEIAARAAD